MKDEKLSKSEIFDAIKLGVKEAIHEMMETGNGYNGIIIRDIVLGEFRNGIADGINKAMPLQSDIEECIRKGISDSMPNPIDIQHSIYHATRAGKEF